MGVYIQSGINTGALTYPLTHARLLWQSLLPDGTVTGPTAAAGFPLTALTNPATYERYQPAAGGANTIAFDAGAAVTADALGIAAHDLGTEGASVAVRYSTDDITYTTLMTETVTDDLPSLFLFDSTTARYWEVVVTSTNAPTIGVLYLGEALAMERPLFAGHTPLPLARQTAVRPMLSESGQWLGATEERIGYRSGFSWRNLTDTWYRGAFDLFVANNPRVNPFFAAWRPSFADDVGYCIANGDIAPSYMGQRSRLQVSMDVTGFGE